MAHHDCKLLGGNGLISDQSDRQGADGSANS